MSSEVTTDADYALRWRRSSGRRRKRDLSPIRLFLLLVLLCAAFTYRESGFLFSNRHVPDTCGNAFLQSTAQASTLKSFAADLVISEADSGTESLGNTHAKDVLLIDRTNEKVLLSCNAYTRMNPTSTTEIMTCPLALEDGGIHMGDAQTAGPEVAVSEPGTSMGGLQQGDKLTVERILYCLMVRSGAGVVNMITEQVVGSEEAFVEKMDACAKELGATGTHFTNSRGLTDPDHHTTPYDLYPIFHETMKYPEFQRLVSQKFYTADYVGAAGQPVQKKWSNTNYYLVDKVKLPEGFSVTTARTGTTLAAGVYLTQLTASESGKQCYSAVLEPPNHDVFYQGTSLLLQESTQVY